MHAAELAFKHPASGDELVLRAPADWVTDPRLLLRGALVDQNVTNAWRVLHGGSDSCPGWHVDRLGDYLLSESERPLNEAQGDELARLRKAFAARGAYHKVLRRHGLRSAQPSAHKPGQECRLEASPQHFLGGQAPERFFIRENGAQFELSFRDGPSVGLFLDQRDNRRRMITGHIGAGFPLYSQSQQAPAVLNAFAYTCAFSICAAKGGGRTTSLDLSKAHLDWGRRNFALNGVDPAGHEFIHGDAFQWLRRLARKQRRFDAVLLDPPTFSRSKVSGVFRIQKDYGRLLAAALPLVKPGGVLLASSNAADWPAQEFLTSIEIALRSSGRNIVQRLYIPQPVDFPISRSEPAYLKTLWMRIE